MMRTISTTIGGKRLGLAMAALCLWAGLGTARAGGTLWYNGDFDGYNEIYNTINSTSGDGIVYNEFVIPKGQTWSISGVYSNDLMNYTSTSLTAYWAILPGGGGSPLYSGTDAATQTDLGPGLPGYDVYNVEVSGLTGVTLGQGTYWLAVVPVAIAGTDYSYIGTTSGANAYPPMSGPDNNSFIAGSYYNNLGYSDYSSAINITTGADGISSPAFSMGINGVPEPSTLAMGLIATLALLGAAGRNRLGA